MPGTINKGILVAQSKAVNIKGNQLPLIDWKQAEMMSKLVGESHFAVGESPRRGGLGGPDVGMVISGIRTQQQPKYRRDTIESAANWAKRYSYIQ